MDLSQRGRRLFEPHFLRYAANGQTNLPGEGNLIYIWMVVGYSRVS